MFGIGKKKEEPKEEPKVEHSVVGETIKFSEIQNFIKYNLNPSNIEAKIEYAIAKENKDKRSFPTGLLIIGGMVLLFGAIAYTIINGSLQNNECMKQLAGLAGAAKPAATQIVSTGLK